MLPVTLFANTPFEVAAGVTLASPNQEPWLVLAWLRICSQATTKANDERGVDFRVPGGEGQ
jgi:hypothetical protein